MLRGFCWPGLRNRPRERRRHRRRRGLCVCATTNAGTFFLRTAWPGLSGTARRATSHPFRAASPPHLRSVAPPPALPTSVVGPGLSRGRLLPADRPRHATVFSSLERRRRGTYPPHALFSPFADAICDCGITRTWASGKPSTDSPRARSEERRVGKECR